MWALLPVKRLQYAKLRLAGVLTPEQRQQLSLCMLGDILEVLTGSAVIDGVTVVSCDADVISLARGKGADVLDTGNDSGYAADVTKGIKHVCNKPMDKVLVIPADVPELEHRDLVYLDRAHKGGVTLCPAANDGGTNGLVFAPPLAMDLKYGENSFEEFLKEAAQRGVTVNIARPAGLVRDVDLPRDLEDCRHKV